MNILEPIHWAVILMLVGCGLVVLEFFIPSGGILGFLSISSIVASIIMAFYHHGAVTGFVFVITAVVLVPTFIGLAVKYWPRTPMGRAFLGDLPDEAEVAPNESRREYIGRFGVAKSKMLPSGAVEIDGRTLDAISQGIAIEKGDRVVVTEVRANRVVVRPAAPEERPKVERPEDMLSKPIEEFGIESLDEPLA